MKTLTIKKLKLSKDLAAELETFLAKWQKVHGLTIKHAAFTGPKNVRYFHLSLTGNEVALYPLQGILKTHFRVIYSTATLEVR